MNDEKQHLIASGMNIVETRTAKCFGGRYTVICDIGFGGWGTVYKCHDMVLNRTVAIKELNTRDQRKLQRFIREATLAAKLNHPNVCAIYDIGAVDSSEPFIVMECIDGVSLERLVQSRQTNAAQLVNVFAQVSAGIQHAHENNVLHRDLKPSNIIVSNPNSPDCCAKVVDFGLAKALRSDDDRLTDTGDVVGTLAYMSPEQCCNMPLDARSDIYSLGCVMFEALTGRVPFEANSSYECMAMHVNQQPQSIAEFDPNMPASLVRIVTRAMEKEPASRYKSAEELRQSLLSVTSSELPLRFPSRDYRAEGTTNLVAVSQGIPRQVLMWMVGVVCFLAIGGSAYYFFASKNASSKAPLDPALPAFVEERMKMIAMASAKRTEEGDAMARQIFDGLLDGRAAEYPTILVQTCNDYRKLVMNGGSNQIIANSKELARCLEVYKKAGVPAEQMASAELDAGTACYYSGNTSDAKSYLESSVKLYESANKRTDAAYALYMLGCNSWKANHDDRALQTIEESIKMSEESHPGGDVNESAALFAAGQLSYQLGKSDEAVDFLRRSLQMRTRLHESQEIIAATSNELQMVLTSTGK